MGKKNNIKDLPRGLQIDTTTGEGANIKEEKEKILLPKKKPIKAFMGIGVEVAKKAKESGAKGLEFLSPLAMVARIAKGERKKSKTMESTSPTLSNTDSAEQKKTGSAKMNMGGEVTVGKGGDYIKDLIK
jgi:hypothetical protein|tara:strand:+ start:821 stop:1210 length:390 start_codon:yes stop_codon:yes gene_type:complete